MEISAPRCHDWYLTESGDLFSEENGQTFEQMFWGNQKSSQKGKLEPRSKPLQKTTSAPKDISRHSLSRLLVIFMLHTSLFKLVVSFLILCAVGGQGGARIFTGVHYVRP